MTLFLLRHAEAGHRESWQSDDHLRPVDERGRRQAECLVAALARFRPDRILSSPAVRCTQTVEPLAAELGLPRGDRRLRRGRRPRAGARAGSWARERSRSSAPTGTSSRTSKEESEKGSIWALELGADGSSGATTFLHPPSRETLRSGCCRVGD